MRNISERYKVMPVVYDIWGVFRHGSFTKQFGD